MKPKKIHPLVSEAQEQLRKGLITRRDFLRISALLGMSVASASVLAACGGGADQAANNNTAVNNTTVDNNTAAANNTAANNTTAADDDTMSTTLVRGGTLRAAARVERVTHPALFDRVSQSNPWRHVFEYLTYMDSSGITYPYLLDKWEASEDLLTWILTLRQGITFNDGRSFTADDVIFNFHQWLSADLDSGLRGAMNYIDPNGLEKQDTYSVIVHLKSPTIFLPEHLYSYPAAIVPAGFGGDAIAEPVGTGAFTMEEYNVGESCVLKARSDYWRKDADGGSLPYLDEIVFVQTAEDRSGDVAALQNGDVDTIIEPSVAVWNSFKDSNFTVVSSQSSSTRVLRMRADMAPFDDNNVRKALKLCHDREKILSAAVMDQGVIGNDSHVASILLDAAALEPLPFDTEEASNLLSDAGYSDGLDVELAVPSDWPAAMAYAETLAADAAAAGFNITLKTMTSAEYWANWKEWPLGITWWAHRPFAPVMLPFAYIKNFDGEFVPWDETHWSDDEFTELLRQAESTSDYVERKDIVAQLEQIQQERGSVCIPFYTNTWQIYSPKVMNVPVSLEEYANFYETWLAG